MKDSINREIDYIRVSVTDRCNYRCYYCMPSGGIDYIEHEEILHYEEIVRILEIFSSMGIKKVKLTGGEPLVRKELSRLVEMIRGLEGIEEVTLTTNGYYLEENIESLLAGGISDINVSIDSLDPDKYNRICGVEGLEKVLCGIEKSLKLGAKLKLNTTLNEMTAEEDILKLVAFGLEKKIKVRFIEMMPIGMGKMHSLSGDAVLAMVKKRYPDLRKSGMRGNGPAVYYQLGDTYLGLISAIHHKFCHSCNRIRLSADGFVRPCLAYGEGVNIKRLLRGKESRSVLEEAIYDAVFHKPVGHRFEEAIGSRSIMSRIGG